MTEGYEVFGNALDRSVLASLRELQDDGDPDIVAEVGGLFLEHSPQKIAAILKAVENGDAKGLQTAAHSLKSSSAYVGAMRLSELSRELEMMGRSQVMDGAEEKAERLNREYKQVMMELDAEIQRSN
ncbi:MULTISPECIES: Hpt domain-containing protein [Methanothrix]|jgi:HPt (histidine-containing phosphotransfer) domain-containing protein|uniref:Two-component hybrid sensor and regulator n=2 Tax=root TaxID=1 RepID=A0A0W8F6W6_9ZZZZ|nr:MULTISPECIES: Hpt domain-containing protein [Methanothrix]MCK9405425.1 Hpt domain-containing protein [Methanothrix sp.]MCK9586825.1 Hpt domain-containing protein [Methanothrix soehngenii]MDD5256877.1 Hpt domain-containing protein [Methanothrix soehngenii]HNZ06125.1 Hpt domain-containing protein [Methanothrix soehngenii]HQI55222.1 Hpt domain-containing protein [Methanothrix soehngenii]